MSHQPSTAEFRRQNATARVEGTNVVITDQSHVVSRHESEEEARKALKKFLDHREMFAKTLK